MIQAYTDDNKLVIGVTRGNIDRLTAGMPMQIEVLNQRRITHILVVFGEDKPSILKQMEEAGSDIAQAWKDAAASDPL